MRYRARTKWHLIALILVLTIGLVACTKVDDLSLIHILEEVDLTGAGLKDTFAARPESMKLMRGRLAS